MKSARRRDDVDSGVGGVVGVGQSHQPQLPRYFFGAKIDSLSSTFWRFFALLLSLREEVSLAFLSPFSVLCLTMYSIIHFLHP